MSLTQQFLIISLLPLSFLVLVGYAWRSHLNRRNLLHWWTIALLAATVWASSVLRFYGGETIATPIQFAWGVVGRYAFTVTAVAILLTSLNHLSLSRQHGRFALNLSGILGMGALILDSGIWPWRIPDFSLNGQIVHHFDLWAAVWIASWLVPIVAAWILSRQVKANFPDSLYLNQIRYWILALMLFIIGGGLASVQQPGQPGWQESGLIIVLMAALIGTISIVHSHLPDLQLASRQLLVRLSGSILIFALTWLALSIIVRSVTNLPANSNPNLLVFLAAALFAGLFTLIFRLVNKFIRHLFLPGSIKHERALAIFSDTYTDLPEPPQLAQSFLHVIQSGLGTDDAWIFTGEESGEGAFLLRPLATLGNYTLENSAFDADSRFIAYLRQNRIPLVQYDIDTLHEFDEITATEKASLDKWQRVLYMPLHNGDSLVGLIALGKKLAGDSYNREDFSQLQLLAPKISARLIQSQKFADLHQINERLSSQNQLLTSTKQYLYEQCNLYAQFIDLISPELREPFISINQQLDQLRERLPDDETAHQIEGDLSQKIDAVRANLTYLIAISGQFQSREVFHLQSTDLDEIVRQAVRGLQTMAEARQVQVAYEPNTSLPRLLGDSSQLQEATYHLLHNAIKFNKIGGRVHLTCGVDNDHLFLQIKDTGVGIPKERLATLWDGLSIIPQNGNGRNARMGLVLAQFIIAAHSGRVTVESEYGSGSTFTVYLPIAFENQNVTRKM